MTEKTKKKPKIFTSPIMVMALLLVGIVVANVFVWRDHFGNRAQADTLLGQIAAVDQKNAGVPAPPVDLDVRLDAAQETLAAAETALPAAINRNDVIDYIIDLANDCGVEAVPLIIEGWAPESPGSPYTVLKLDVTLTGSLAGVTAMIAGLQDSIYGSLTVTNLNVNFQGKTTSSGFSDDTPVTAGMNIVLYASSPPI
jgi:hypothetical protein